MPKLTGISGEETVKALRKLGFVFLRQRGSHAILRRGSQGCEMINASAEIFSMYDKEERE